MTDSWPKPWTAKGSAPDDAFWYRAQCTWHDIPGGATPVFWIEGGPWPLPLFFPHTNTAVYCLDPDAKIKIEIR